MPIEYYGLILFAGSMIGTPGPANMVVMASGARFGFRASLPFLAGTILGKQFIIWPIGLGLMSLLSEGGVALRILQLISLAYILWLAWKIAGTRIIAASGTDTPPGFALGLIVHPLNPKAWAMVVGSFANFANADAAPLLVTAAMAAVFLMLQIVLQSFWTLLGARIARIVAGTRREIWLMRALAVVMLASVAVALMNGGT